MSELPLLERSISTKISDLRHLAREVGIDVQGLQPKAILEKVVGELSSQRGVMQALDACSEDARTLIFDIAWHGLGMLTGRTIDGLGVRNPRAQRTRELCEELRQKGLLHSLGSRDYWASQPGYHMAHETVQWVAPVAAMQAAGKLQRPFYLPVGERPADAASLGTEWLSDLLRIVGELGRRPAAITQGGSIYRRDAERVRRLLTPHRLPDISPAFAAILGELPDPATFGPWSGEAQPDVGLLLWLGFGLGLLDVREGEIHAARDWRRRLGRRSVAEIGRRAVLAVWELHGHALTADYWQKFLSAEHWLLPQRLLEVLHVKRTGIFEAREPYETASLIRSLGQIGALEAGTVEGEPALHLLPLGAVLYGGQAPEPTLDGRWTLLPSGDILAPPDLAPTRLAWLETVARPAKVDVVCTYQMSQESLQHAVEMLVKPDEILAELEAGSRTGLPQAMRFRIEEWLGRVGRYRFVEAAMLVCRSKADAEAALALKVVRQEVIEVIGETCLVIPAMHAERVRAALEHGGFAALEGVFSPSGLYREDALKERRRTGRTLRSLDWGVGTVIEPL